MKACKLHYLTHPPLNVRIVTQASSLILGMNGAIPCPHDTQVTLLTKVTKV